MTPTLSETLPDHLRQIRTRPLFVMRLEVKPIVVVGQTPGGVRRMGPVPGGIFEGERLSGILEDGGNDWQAVHTDGAISIDARLILRTSDDALIAMSYRGIRHGPPDILTRIDHGEVVDPSSYYFRVSPTFETAAPRYDWINRVLAVGIGHRLPGGPVYSIFEIL